MDATPQATPPTTAHKLSAEAIGTLILVAVSCGAAIGADGVDGVNPLAAGFALVALTYAFGRFTGGHFNPAVTLGSVLSGRTAWSEGGKLIGAQFAGGIVAGLLLLVFGLGNDNFEAFESRIGTNSWGDEGTGYAWWAALLVTLVVTAFFVILWLALTDLRNDDHLTFAPLAIGLAYAAALYATLSATGGTVNPAQSLGTALFSGADPLKQVGIFLLGTILGGVAAGFAYRALFGADRDKVPGSGLEFGGPKAPQQNFGPGGYQQQWNQPGGYQQPGQPGQVGQPGQSGQVGQPGQTGAYAAPAAQAAAPQPAVEQPIIQDGWQWDPQAQQWIPAQQQAPQQSWQNPAAGEQTQVRPNDGI
jgi:aquaporin Z